MSPIKPPLFLPVIATCLASLGVKCTSTELSPPGGKVYSLQFSPDGNWLAAARGRSANGIGPQGVEVWRITKDGPLDRVTLFDDNEAYDVRFEPDSLRLACNSKTGLSVWDVVGRTRLFEVTERGVRAFAFLRDGKSLVTSGQLGGEDATLAFWDAANGKMLRTIDADGAVDSLDVDPSGQFLATHEGRAIVVRDATTGEKLRVLEESKHIDRDLRFDPTGRWLGVLRNTSRIVFFDVRTWQKAGETAEHNMWSDMSSPGGSFAFHSSGNVVFTGSGGREDSRIRAWSVPDGKLLGVVGRHHGAILSLAAHPTLDFLASGSGSEKEIWDSPAARQHCTVRLWRVERPSD